MKHIVYTIYDTAAAFYKKPFCLNTDAQAQREFTDIFASENPISQHPEHYALIRIGTYDDSNAKFVPEIKKTLITGLEALAIRNKENEEHVDEMLEQSAGGTN